MLKLFFSLLCLTIHLSYGSEEPLGRNYRKHLNSLPINSHINNNGKILSVSDTKISAVSLKPNENKFSTYIDNINTSSSEDKLSIGLGVLSPSYYQKFGEDGKTKLDFNSDKGGFSYSLTNVVHPSSNSNQPTSVSVQSTNPGVALNTLNKIQSAGFVPSSYYNNPTASQPSQSNAQINIYHKQTADPNAIYGRLTGNNYPLPPNPLSSNSYSENHSPISSLTTGNANPAANSFAASQIPGTFGYNAIQNQLPQPFPIYGSSFNPGLTEAEKSFLQTVPQSQQQVTTHQHQLPQQLPQHLMHQLPQQIPQLQSQQSITQPKLVSQQQLTANPNSGNIVHNQNYGTSGINPYSPNLQNSNPYLQNQNQLYNPSVLNYPNLAVAASQQYPSMIDGYGMNYDYLNDFIY